MMLTVGYDIPEQYPQACLIAQQLNLPVAEFSALQLIVTADKLTLNSIKQRPLFVDFNAVHMSAHLSKNHGLIKACKPKPGLKIIDATAGWGKDALMLATKGAQVLMLERHPVMALLLNDGLKRCTSKRLSLNLSLRTTDALTYLTTLAATDYPDIIYLDPMHPKRQKSALVKKELQALQLLIGPDSDALALLQLAQQRVQCKVVVKWPEHQPPLLPPSTSIRGKTVRFDIFAPTIFNTC